jgi:uncharacterized membrane protein YhiD involved in acid resistance
MRVAHTDCSVGLGSVVGSHLSVYTPPMLRILAALILAIPLVFPLGKLTAAPPRDQETKQLKKRHKAQNKEAKQQQRAMKRVMAQHEQSSDSRARFKHDLKMQRQMLRRSQKEETQRMKKKRKSDKKFHSSR